ncbi:MAG: TonB-dependent receptor, partial [Ignavibacteriae bacterium]
MSKHIHDIAISPFRHFAVSPFRLFAFSLFLLLLPSLLFSQGTINGYITDRETGDSLAGVSVRIEGTRLGAISNSRGRFTIKNVPLGQIEMQASLIGYSTETIRTYLGKDGQANVVFTMMSSGFLKDEVIVSAGRRVQAVQDVPISVASLSQQDLAQRGITQLDQALRYVSGVSVVGDQVNIRGASGFAFG